MISHPHEELRSMVVGEVRRHEPLRRYTTLKIGGPAEWMVYPADVDDLVRVVGWCDRRGVPCTYLGFGSNVLVPDEGLSGVVLRTRPALDFIRFSGKRVRVGAGAGVARLVGQAANRGLSGLEGLAGVPGSVGGALVMNAGTADGQIGSRVRWVRVLNEKGVLRTLPAEALEFSYRSSLLQRNRNWLAVEAELELLPDSREKTRKRIDEILKYRNRTQPLHLPNAGSIFKNPPGDAAGRLIETVGCKGLRRGDAQVSELHANWIVNLGRATAEDVLQLILEVSETCIPEHRHRLGAGNSSPRRIMRPLDPGDGRSAACMSFTVAPRRDDDPVGGGTVDVFSIQGGTPLSGTVEIQGAKNSALPVMASTTLTPSVFVLKRIPKLRDTQVMCRLLEELGAELRWEDSEDRVLWIDTRGIRTGVVPDSLSRQMRSSIVLFGPLLARFGRARISYPGGCVIGPRPIDLHLRGLRELGAKIEERGGFIEGRADRLRGAHMHLDFPSVGATEHLMMTAVLAEGRTVIGNAAKEPEIVDLQEMLVAMGARVRGAGTDRIIIDGTPDLEGAVHEVIPDRIEAGTFLLAGAITGGDVTVTRVIPDHCEALLAKLRETGVRVTWGEGWIRVQQAERLTSTNMKTQPYPGFPTDLQNPFLVLLCLAEGTGVVTETIWGNRFKVVEELRRMGAEVQIQDRIAIVKGVAKLTGAQVEAAEDLRGGAALVLAGLAAQGETQVWGARFVDRGYEDFVEKLSRLGASIRRVS